MKKMTKAELTRNAIYATVATTQFDGYENVGNVKEGFLIKNSKTGENAIVKIILKKTTVDYDTEQVERLTENVVEEKTEVKAKDTKEVAE